MYSNHSWHYLCARNKLLLCPNFLNFPSSSWELIITHYITLLCIFHLISHSVKFLNIWILQWSTPINNVFTFILWGYHNWGLQCLPPGLVIVFHLPAWWVSFQIYYFLWSRATGAASYLYFWLPFLDPLTLFSPFGFSNHNLITVSCPFFSVNWVPSKVEILLHNTCKVT